MFAYSVLLLVSTADASHMTIAEVLEVYTDFKVKVDVGPWD